MTSNNALESLGISLSTSMESKTVEFKDVITSKPDTKDVFEDFKFDDDVNDSVDEFLFDTQSLKIDSSLNITSMEKVPMERSETVIDDMEWLEAQKEKKLTSQKKETKSLMTSTETSSSVVDDSQLTEEVINKLIEIKLFYNMESIFD